MTVHPNITRLDWFRIVQSRCCWKCSKFKVCEVFWFLSGREESPRSKWIFHFRIQLETDSSPILYTLLGIHKDVIKWQALLNITMVNLDQLWIILMKTLSKADKSKKMKRKKIRLKSKPEARQANGLFCWMRRGRWRQRREGPLPRRKF